MGDGDEALGPLPKGLPLQVGDAVLGDDVVHIVPGGRYRRAMGEEGHDAGHLAAGSGGGHGDDRLAARAHAGAAHEIHLAAHPAELPEPDGLGAHLAHEVHFDAGVDGNHLVVLHDHHGVVHVIHRVELHQRVVVHEIVEPLAAHEEGGPISSISSNNNKQTTATATATTTRRRDSTHLQKTRRQR